MLPPRIHERRSPRTWRPRRVGAWLFDNSVIVILSNTAGSGSVRAAVYGCEANWEAATVLTWCPKGFGVRAPAHPLTEVIRQDEETVLNTVARKGCGFESRRFRLIARYAKCRAAGQGPGALQARNLPSQLTWIWNWSGDSGTLKTCKARFDFGGPH